MCLTGFQTALISAAFGALFGALSALLLNAFADWYRLERIYGRLGLEPQQKNGTRVTARVHNGYIFPLNSAYAYITIDHEESDVLEPPNNFEAYVRPAHLLIVREDRLCWSVASNPASVDIYAGERQVLDVANFDRGGIWIEIPSESGWGTVGGTSRVFLKWKKYSATIKIVSKDSKAKEFPVQIDPDNLKVPLTLRSR